MDHRFLCSNYVCLCLLCCKVTDMLSLNKAGISMQESTENYRNSVFVNFDPSQPDLTRGHKPNSAQGHLGPIILVCLHALCCFVQLLLQFGSPPSPKSLLPSHIATFSGAFSAIPH